MKIVKITLCSIFVMLNTGCASRFMFSDKTFKSRSDALVLDQRVAEYEKIQQERVARLNKQYQNSYVNLSNALEEHTYLSLDQQAYFDAQKVADSMLLNWEKDTLPSHLITQLDAHLVAQRERLEAAEASLDSARTDYASAYEELSIDLKKTKRLRSHLQDLASEKDSVGTFLQLAGWVVKAYEESQEKAEKAGATSGAASK